MKHGSLFSGIGGFDLAAEWMGWENVFHCEIEEFPRKILNHYWPEAISYDDITKTDFTIHNGKIDILTGGFPCQPYSQAGKRRGKDDERHLWPEMLRTIREVAPRWIVGENVLGIVNWNDGLVFEEVQTDLEAEGYEVQTFVLPASAVGAPHQRYRVWFVAYSANNGFKSGIGRGNRNHQGEPDREGIRPRFRNENIEHGSSRNVADTENDGRNGSRHQQREIVETGKRNLFQCSGERRDEVRAEPERHREGGDVANSNGIGSREKSTFTRTDPKGEYSDDPGPVGRNVSKGDDPNTGGTGREEQYIAEVTEEQGHRSRFCTPDWRNFPTQSPVCSGNDGVPAGLDGITFSKWRTESIKGYGNAVVPQVVLQIFKTIERHDTSNRDNTI